MPIYRRYRRAGYRRRRRGYYGRRRYRRSYARRFVNGSSRSTIRMKCNQTATFQATAGYTDAATGAVVNVVNPYSNNDTSVTANELYRAYVGLYEETKIIGLKVALSVASTVGGPDIPSLQIYSTWDRRFGHGENSSNVDEIKMSANSTVATALNNNVAKITRSCYASDLMEKAQWHDCSLIPPTAANGGKDAAWVAAGANPNFFCPSFQYFFNNPTKGNATTAINYTLSITYYIAFRNPRYGGSASNRELASKAVSFADDEYGDDADDEGDVDMPDAEPENAPPPAPPPAAPEPREGSLRKSRRAHPPGPVQKNA